MNDFFKEHDKSVKKMWMWGVIAVLVNLLVTIGLFIGACYVVKWIFF